MLVYIYDEKHYGKKYVKNMEIKMILNILFRCLMLNVSFKIPVYKRDFRMYNINF